eukprot:11218878-Lingulodinium_polyedra.AAC.1
MMCGERRLYKHVFGKQESRMSQDVFKYAATLQELGGADLATRAQAFQEFQQYLLLVVQDGTLLDPWHSCYCH